VVAEHLHMTVREIKAKLSHVEFVEWLAYLRLKDREQS
jgi:hypothetical protein